MTKDRHATPYLTLNVPQVFSQNDDEQHETVVSMLDHRATHMPQKVAVGFPETSGGGQEWTFAQLRTISLSYGAAMIDRINTCADTHEPLVIGLMAPSGPGLLAHILACWRIGCAVLPIAVGTTPKGIASLLQQTGAKYFFTQGHEEEVQRVRELIGEDIVALGWINEKDVCANAEWKRFRTASPDSILTIFHSSGSSGVPKPIDHPNRFWTRSMTHAYGADKAAFTTTPLFHGGLSDLLRAFQAGAALFCFPWHSRQPPTPKNIVDCMTHCSRSIHYFLSVPFILESFLASSELSVLQSMDLVSTGGAPLPPHVGHAMVNEHHVRLVSRMGSSECGFLFSSWRDFSHDKEWSWLHVEDERTKQLLTFERRDEDDLFELVVGAQWPAKLLENRPDGGFATGDLFERRSADRWRYVRRSDDNIVMVNGKKIAAMPIEEAFKASKGVVDALVFGANRPMLGAILCFECEEHDLPTLLKRVNATLPPHAQIVREMVLIDRKGVLASLPRTSKGTLQRGMALEQIDSLLCDIYNHFERGEATEKRTFQSTDELVAWLLDTARQITGNPTIGSDTDLFGAGVDSITAARIRAAVHQHVATECTLSQNAVYDHQTVRGLAMFIQSGGAEHAKEDAKATSKQMVERYAGFADANDRIDPSDESPAVVLLTGATGTLGSRILADLLQDERGVEHVVCHVRARDEVEATKRIENGLRQRRLDADMKGKVSCVVEFARTSMAMQRFLHAKRSIVIHCGWIVNFALALPSFEHSCVATLRALLLAYAECTHPARFVFCSSLAVIQQADAPLLERFSDAIEDAGSTGYSQSKWVGEQICRSAARVLRNVTIARVGQLCGDSKEGIWNETEAWPLLVRTSIEIGALPSQGPDVDWLPVDVAAKAINECAFGANAMPLVHIALPPKVPRPTWPTFVDYLSASRIRPFEILPNEQWLDRVQKAGGQVRGRALLPIWASMATASTEHRACTDLAERNCLAIRQAKAVDKALCDKFVDAWMSSGFLSTA